MRIVLFTGSAKKAAKAGFESFGNNKFCTSIWTTLILEIARSQPA